MSNARKLFRLFKYLNEYVKCKDIMKQDLPQLDKYLALAVRIAFAGFWVFDNFVVLCKIKFITSLELKSMMDKAARFWLLALILMAWQAIRGLAACALDEAKLRLSKGKVG